MGQMNKWEAPKVSLTLRGQLTNKEAKEFVEWVGALLQNGTRYIHVELGRVGFIDIVGLQTLYQLAKKLQSVQGELTLSGLRKSTRDILRLMHMDQTIRVTA